MIRMLNFVITLLILCAWTNDELSVTVFEVRIVLTCRNTTISIKTLSIAALMGTANFSFLNFKAISTNNT